MDNETLITLTSDIVSAHVSNNSVAVNDLPSLIQSVYQALATACEMIMGQMPVEVLV